MLHLVSAAAGKDVRIGTYTLITGAQPTVTAAMHVDMTKVTTPATVRAFAERPVCTTPLYINVQDQPVVTEINKPIPFRGHQQTAVEVPPPQQVTAKFSSQSLHQILHTYAAVAAEMPRKNSVRLLDHRLG